MISVLRVIAFRLMQAAGVALIVGVMSFLMMQAMPGDMAWRLRFGRRAAAASSPKADLHQATLRRHECAIVTLIMRFHSVMRF